MGEQGCVECRRLSDAYESATMTWFRVEGQFRIAEFGHDKAAVKELASELAAIGERRSALRDALARHKAEHEVRPVVMKAGG